MTWIIAIGMFLLGFVFGVLAASLGSMAKTNELERQLAEERMRREREFNAKHFFEQN